jgi:hypothetical protein
MVFILLNTTSILHNILGFLNTSWVQWTESGNDRMGVKNLRRHEMKLLMTEMIQLINRSTDTLLTQWKIKCNNQHLDIYDHQALLHLTWQKCCESFAMAWSPPLNSLLSVWNMPHTPWPSSSPTRRILLPINCDQLPKLLPHPIFQQWNFYSWDIRRPKCAKHTAPISFT